MGYSVYVFFDLCANGGFTVYVCFMTNLWFGGEEVVRRRVPFQEVLLADSAFRVLGRKRVVSAFGGYNVFCYRHNDIRISLRNYRCRVGPKSICVCVTSALIRLLRGDRSTRKVVIRISFCCVLPVMGGIVGIRDRLFVQGGPYISLSSRRYTRFRCLLGGL